MEIKWNAVKTDEDIKNVLDHFGHFHDACLKEAKYISGSYVNENYSMKPIDDLRQVNIIIQKQNRIHSVIEFQFEGIERLNIVPAEANYDSIISGVLLELRDGYIYFADYGINIDELEKYSSRITWIKAKRLKWREVNQYIGSSEIYLHRPL